MRLLHLKEETSTDSAQWHRQENLPQMSTSNSLAYLRLGILLDTHFKYRLPLLLTMATHLNTIGQLILWEQSFDGQILLKENHWSRVVEFATEIPNRILTFQSFYLAELKLSIF